MVAQRDWENITGRFNDIIENKRLFILNELSSVKGNFHVNFDKLKDLITNDYINIEEKGFKTRRIKNILNLVGFTNNIDSLKISKSNRRYNVFEVNPLYIGDTEFFNELHSYIDDELIQQAFYNYLYNFKSVKLNRIIRNWLLKRYDGAFV